MKQLLISLLIFLSLNTFAQQRKYSTFYEQRVSLFDTLPINSEDIVFLGNSITNGGEWCELFENEHIKNRGISGDTSEGVYDRLENITKGKPKKIFLMIGINDIARNIPVDTIAKNIEKIILKIKEDSAGTKIYLQSALPVNPDFNMFAGHMKPNSIKSLNKQIKNLSLKHQTTYIDLYSQFTIKDSDKLSPQYTNDGLHLLGEAYLRWAEILKPYVEERNKKR
ncbi:GDSL-type esterase/lipase family protein [Bacteroidales bacterium OttesenSCG-928-M11]|nr:GDSL-type esterase/lipase family protein [Bacteroidales bacterium OttesenSCG-928-M11]